jgi:hypothetical protein
MTERVDMAADGDWPPDELTDLERRELATTRQRAAELRESLVSGMPADLDRRVMRRVRQLGLEPLPQQAPQRTSTARGVAAALWQRREVRFALRPAYALAAVALLALVPLIERAMAPAHGPSGATSGATDHTRIFVQFSLRAEDASHVALAGSFTDWEPLHSLHPTVDGVWTLMLPLEPGVHDYSFVVDGQRWVPDPYAPHVDDGFGGVNSRITLLAAAAGL